MTAAYTAGPTYGIQFTPVQLFGTYPSVPLQPAAPFTPGVGGQYITWDAKQLWRGYPVSHWRFAYGAARTT